jgi:radical SAM family uncharacterized protein
LLSSTQIQDRLERILLRVQKPGRYVGGEYNHVLKEWLSVDIHLALVFPDIYDIGLSNLGLAILYDQVNSRPDALAERAYCPWVDMEMQMRSTSLPLFTLESKHALADFDIVAITLPYETLYTNTLNLLDLAGIPLFSSERSQQHPLVIAGGNACYNPEPMSAFIDAFVIGEGEEVIHEVIDAVKTCKAATASRARMLADLAKIPGVYVPSLYEPLYNPDGTLEAIQPLQSGLPKSVRKRLVAKLPPPPTHFIVPSIETVHNRVSVEIMRGCTRGCRFCHAGMINRPVRERSIPEIVAAIQTALGNTGFEEIALLSLSSSDYTHILELVDEISQKFANQHLTISLPSLRIESTSVDLFEKLKGSRQSSFTLAPEAATDRMRNIINKPIPEEQLLNTVRAIYSRGWLTIKLYFMIGHPSETLEDVQAIANLCKAVLAEGRKVCGRRAALHAGVSTFIPKPHTPFQWVSCDTLENIEAKQRLLMKELVCHGFKLNWADPKETFLEAWLSRGDRRMSAVIYRAWQNGAKFDAWQDQFLYTAWISAFEEIGLDPGFYTHRQRSLDEVLPWDIIDTGVTKRYLKKDFQMSLQGEVRADCREQCYACGILPNFLELRRQTSQADWKCPEVTSKNIASFMDG